ncbi:MAG: low molecular weight protein arginine phosphatase [Clostridia bacterium]|nr:low molecular weight protein arginine phosphatase [Clostridia bacterium]
MKPYILFVCSANTCRSAMAEALFNHYAEEAGITLRARSCGLDAEDGLPASLGAIEAMEAYGIDLSAHRTQRISIPLMKNALMIITMTREEAQYLTALLEHSPELQKRVSALEPDVPEPYGGDESDYRRAAAMLDEVLCALVESKE